MPIAAPLDGEGDIEQLTLPGGKVAAATHMGSYDQLNNAYQAIEQWISAAGLKSAGAPWEVYVTDPGAVPDPKDWRTDVFWPVADS